MLKSFRDRPFSFESTLREVTKTREEEQVKGSQRDNEKMKKIRELVILMRLLIGRGFKLDFVPTFHFPIISPVLVHHSPFSRFPCSFQSFPVLVTSEFEDSHYKEVNKYVT